MPAVRRYASFRPQVPSLDVLPDFHLVPSTPYRPIWIGLLVPKTLHFRAIQLHLTGRLT